MLDKDKVTLELLDGAGHGGPAFNTTENIDKVFKFLDKYLKTAPTTVAKYIIFTGRVQGVGFRNRTRLIANRYKLTGFVRNLKDGTVELLAQGRAQDVDNCLRDIKEFFANNIKQAKIDDIAFEPKYTDFRILY